MTDKIKLGVLIEEAEKKLKKLGEDAERMVSE